MSKGLKTTVAIVLLLALGFPAYAGYELWTTDSKVQEAREELKSDRSNFQGWKDTAKDAQKDYEATEERAKVLSAAAKARQSFDSSLEAAKEQLQLASGSLSIEDAQRRIVAAQNRVLEKDVDSKTIEEQTRELDTVTAELKERRGASLSSSPTSSTFSQAMEAALNAVGEALS